MYTIQAKNAVEQSIVLSGWMQQKTDTAVLCEQKAYADIAVACSLTRRLRAHFYLVDGLTVGIDAMRSMKRAGVIRAVIIGGEDSIRLQVENHLKQAFKTVRLAGKDAADTARKAAEWLHERQPISEVWVERSNDPLQRLIAGAKAARTGCALLLGEGEEEEELMRTKGWSVRDRSREVLSANTVVIADADLLNYPASAVFAAVKNAEIVDPRTEGRGTVYRMGTNTSVMLDPGHGKGVNRYAIRGASEGEVMFDYSRILGKKLEAAGWRVGYTRTNVWENPSLAARGRMAAGYDLLLSLHSNAMPGNQPKVRGTEVFDSLQSPHPILGGALSQAIAEVFAHANRGVKYRRQDDGRDWYGILRDSRATHSFLIEHGFHTNPLDAAIMMDRQPEIADRTVRVLEQWKMSK